MPYIQCYQPFCQYSALIYRHPAYFKDFQNFALWKNGNKWTRRRNGLHKRQARSKKIRKRDEFRNTASPETKLVMSAIYCWQQQIRTDLSFIISPLSPYSSTGRVQNNFMSRLLLKFICTLNFLPPSLFTVSNVRRQIESGYNSLNVGLNAVDVYTYSTASIIAINWDLSRTSESRTSKHTSTKNIYLAIRT